MMFQVLVVAIALSGVALPLFGQIPSDQKLIELTRREIQVKRRTIVEQAIDLTDQENKPFWALYLDWRAKSAGLGDRRLALISNIDDAGSLTDADAKKLLDEWIKLQKDGLKLRQEYIKRFRKILPDKKVARFFQLENKMDAIIDYDLVGRVPLVE